MWDPKKLETYKQRSTWSKIKLDKQIRVVGKPDGVELGLGLAVVFRSTKHTHDIMK